MTFEGLATLLAVVAVASYVQALTGFALGLVLMGGIALTGIMPLQDAAVLSSLLVLLQGAQVLRTGWRDVAWRPLMFVFIGSAPGILAGYALLMALAQVSLALPQLLLGLLILAASIQLLFKPEPLPTMSPNWAFSVTGAIGGVMSGLFSTSGPPLVYLFYRQPLPLRTLRETLALAFVFNGTVRLGAVVGSGHLPPPSTWWALAALPTVLVLTYIARRWPPPLSDAMLRRLAFVLLALSGLSLAAPAVIALAG